MSVTEAKEDPKVFNTWKDGVAFCWDTLGKEYCNCLEQDLPSLQVESFLERNVNHLRPQGALAYKKMETYKSCDFWTRE